MAATISADPRFQLARALISGQASCNDTDRAGHAQRGGGPEAAINLFATLLDLCDTQDSMSLNAALCQYEYGNALFRAVVRQHDSLLSEKDDTAAKGDDGQRQHTGDQGEGADEKPAAQKESQRDIMAAAALKRSALNSDAASPSRKRVKVGGNSASDDAGLKQEESEIIHDKTGDEDQLTSANGTEQGITGGTDLTLALEMMETSLGKFLSHATNEGGSQQQQQQQWALGQLPRVLVCIGDLHAFRGHCGGAVDAYCRALPYREAAWKRAKQRHAQNGDVADLTVEDLRCQRLLIEAYVLVTEGLMACPEGADVVCDYDETTEGSALVAKGSTAGKSNILVKGKERIHFAESHYAMAREGLDELLYRYGKMAAADMELGDEKKDIAYVVMMVSGIGNSLKYGNE